MASFDAIHETLPGTVFGPISGSTPTAARQKTVDDFTAHTGSAVLLA